MGYFFCGFTFPQSLHHQKPSTAFYQDKDILRRRSTLYQVHFPVAKTTAFLYYVRPVVYGYPVRNSG